LGLLAALRWYTDRVAQRSNLSIHISNNLPEIKLDPGIETNCFRIVQEALTNIIKQANAQNVIIDLRLCNQYIQLTIENDSVGFKAQADNGLNLGLLRLQERALLSGGNLVIESLPKAGTRVVVLLGLVKERN
jgi:signal transduction histidine kinase